MNHVFSGGKCRADVAGSVQVEAESAGREDALQAAEEALEEAEATARVAMKLKEELYEATEAAQHLQAELAAAQVGGF